jgi:hypothetical protein
VSGKYPRTFSICTGIFFPLWFLVLVCLFFGHFLAKLESQGEIDSNDAYMKRIVVTERSRQLVGDTIPMLPIVCYQLYMNGTMLHQIDEAVVQILGEQSLAEYADEFDESEIVTRNADLREFMTACGRVALDALYSIEAWYESLDVDNSVYDLSFNWIRCIDDSIAEDFIIFPSKAQKEASRPEAQADFYSQTWRRRQLNLDEKHVEEFSESTESTFTAILQAFKNSVDNATAGDK